MTGRRRVESELFLLLNLNHQGVGQISNSIETLCQPVITVPAPGGAVRSRINGNETNRSEFLDVEFIRELCLTGAQISAELRS